MYMHAVCVCNDCVYMYICVYIYIYMCIYVCVYMMCVYMCIYGVGVYRVLKLDGRFSFHHENAMQINK